MVRSHSENSSSSNSEPPGDTIDPAEVRSDDSDASADSFIKGDEEPESESEDDATIADMRAEVCVPPLTLPNTSSQIRGYKREIKRLCRRIEEKKQQ